MSDSNPVVFTGRFTYLEKAIEKIKIETKDQNIEWQVCEEESDYSYKTEVEGREVFVGYPGKLKVGGNENSEPFVYRGKTVRRLLNTVSFVFMPESVRSWMDKIINK